ncbi:MAG: hypothetical protein SXA11_12455 [Cyanobacteriota bacterium]|nr:hypothetical protein [Cyanobacteriota bacterium]
MDKQALKEIFVRSLEETVEALNRALRGENVEEVQPVIKRVSGGKIPNWYSHLVARKALPNLDGKTVGSVIEKLLVAVLETVTFKDIEGKNLTINPAKGVDLPELEIGIKSPSENFCTSEPFYSAYERLLGSEYDCLVLLTNYQTAKKKPPLQLEIINFRYLYNTELADATLSRLARKHREWLIAQNEAAAKKIFWFLAYVNKSDWRGKWLLQLIDRINSDEIAGIINKAEIDFAKKNKKFEKENKELISEREMQALKKIKSITPAYIGIIDAASNWVIDFYGDAARLPNENEWKRLKSSNLNGKITMSFALQWRYNFKNVFDEKIKE